MSVGPGSGAPTTLGVDVGGTNTDAVILRGREVVAKVKTPTTEDITGGIEAALAEVVAAAPAEAGLARGLTVGTTHFVNAVVQRRGLNRVAAVRICLPASASLPPFVDWPADLAAAVEAGVYLVGGGHEFDGRPIAPLDEDAVREAARSMRRTGVDAVAIAAVFSPLTDGLERRAAELVRAEHPSARITCSADVGRIGLLERENATLLNAALLDLAERTANAFAEARDRAGVEAALYITQNDGTVAPVDRAQHFPVFSFASGPTNSMRGAAFLAGLDDAMVCDVGGTTTDVGALVHGFPREANNVIDIGGVRTLFRMPDVMSVALGGGTRVHGSGLADLTLGPDSVGHRLRSEARVFGGQTLTCTDIAVARGWPGLGDEAASARMRTSIDGATAERVGEMIATRIEDSVDRMKTDAAPVPLIAVGGGAMLVPEQLAGVSQVLWVEHHEVANAVGAALAEVSGEVDRIYRDVPRAQALADAEQRARAKARAAGAEPDAVRVVDVEDLPLAYLPGNALRVRVRVVGPVAFGL